MRKYFAIDMPATLAAITCLLVFLVCYVSLGSLPRFLAERRLAQQADMVVRGFDEGFEAARRDLEQLPSLAGLNCQQGVSPVLARHEFENTYVRWFGVAQNEHVICSSPIVQFQLPPRQERYRQDDVWSAAMVHSSSVGDYLVVIQTRPEADYIAMLEPLLFDFVSPIPCADCVSYEAVMGRNQELRMKAGSTGQSSAIRFTMASTILRSSGRLMLSANQAYVNNFKSEGRLLAAGIAAITALTLSFMLYALLMRRTSMASVVKQGLRRNEFLPYYQPIVDGRDGSVLGAEAVVRWYRRGKLIPPRQFIPFAEENGFIGPITEQLVKKVLKDIKELGWIGTDRYISINAEPDQIVKSGFCEMLARQMAESGIPGKNIAVEITERRQLKDLAAGRVCLLRLTEAGVDIKIDDAGTGFGGFSYVQELPVSTLKIDKMFIDTLRVEGDAKRPVLDAIIDFAKRSGLDTVAEGVETMDQVAYLVKSGVHAIQGYVYSRPMSAQKLMKWVKEQEVRLPV